MNLVFLRKLLIFFIITSPFTLFAENSELFWSDWIQSAIISRESSFRNIGINDDLRIEQLNNHQKKSLFEKVDSISSSNPWYNFLCGKLNDNKSDIYFNKALHNSRKDPGTTWLLFLEFTKYNKKKLENKSLTQLHKLLLEAGAQSSSLISKQLLHFALESKKSNNKNEALEYINWAKTFDTVSIQPEIEKFWLGFPISTIAYFKYFFSSTLMLNSHWEIHLRFLYSLYMWVRNALVLFVLSVFSIYVIKYFPSAVHFLTDRFSKNVSLTSRTLLASAIILSFISFGFIPFLWFCAFFIWRFTNKKEKILFLCSLLFLLLSPVDAVVQNIYRKTFDQDGMIMSFSRAIREGYSEQQHQKVYTFCKNNPSNYLANLTNAVYSLKNNNLVSSLKYGEQSLALHPHDPVVQTNVGNIYFLNGDFDKAASLYKLASEKGYIEAHFNLAQCLFHNSEASTASELIRKAALIEPEKINSFLKNNDKYFTDKWPSLRKVMFTDYSPEHFWTILIPSSIYYGKDIDMIWGNSFLGLSFRNSFILSFILYAILIILTLRIKNKRKLRTTFECRYCGRVVCRKCKTGLLCNSCSEAVKLIRNEDTIHKIHLTIWSKFQRFRIIRESLINILFPGSGSILGERKPYWLSVTLLVTTSFIYSFYFIVVQNLLLRQGFSIKTILLIITFSLYNLFFIIKEVPLFLKN